MAEIKNKFFIGQTIFRKGSGEEFTIKAIIADHPNDCIIYLITDDGGNNYDDDYFEDQLFATKEEAERAGD